MKFFLKKDKSFELNYKTANEILRKIEHISYSLSENELIKLLEIKFEKNFVKEDPMIITSFGDVIDVTKVLEQNDVEISRGHITHRDLGLAVQKVVYEKRIQSQDEKLIDYSIKDILIAAEQEEKNNNLFALSFVNRRLDTFNWIKINGGTNMIGEISYVFLPSSPSKYQLMTVEDFINKLYEWNSRSSVQIYVEGITGDIDTKEYSFVNLLPEEIMKRIKRKISSGHFYEGLREKIEKQRDVEYKGFTIEHFPYTMQLGDEEFDVDGWIIHSPYQLTNSGYYLPLYCEDENGEEINFTTLDDAKRYIDTYIITKRGRVKVKYGDEVHFEIIE